MRVDLPRSRFIEAAGLRHRVLSWEGTSERTLVFLHGILEAAGTFSPLIARLPADSRVVALDFRGHGASSWLPLGGSYFFYDYVRDLRAVVSALGLERPILVGHSMGGSVAALYAGTWPEDVERLVLMEGLGPPGEEQIAGPTRMRRWTEDMDRYAGGEHRTYPTMEAVCERMMERNRRLEAARAAELAPWLAEACDGGFRWRFDPAHRSRTPSIYQPERVRPFLEAITCPVLLVTGGQSWYRYPDLERRRGWIENAERLHLPGAGHMLHHEAPLELAQAIDGFARGA